MNTLRALPILALVFAAADTGAEVKGTTASSLEVESTVVVPAGPRAAFEALTRGLPEWWDGAHTWSGDAGNLSLDAKAGGCFCERLPDGGSVQHGQVIFVQPGRLLRLNAALGPFQEMAIQGVLTFQLVPEGEATRVTVSYRVSGALTVDPPKLAPMVDAMLGGQLGRFRDHVAAGGRPAG